MINYPCWDQSQSMLTRGAEGIFTVQLYSTPILRQWAVSLMMLHPQEYQCKWKNMGKYEQINNMNLLGADTIQKQMVKKTVERMYIWYNIWHIIIYRIQPGRPEDLIRSDTAVSGNTVIPSHFHHILSIPEKPLYLFCTNITHLFTLLLGPWVKPTLVLKI